MQVPTIGNKNKKMWDLLDDIYLRDILKIVYTKTMWISWHNKNKKQSVHFINYIISENNFSEYIYMSFTRVRANSNL